MFTMEYLVDNAALDKHLFVCACIYTVLRNNHIDAKQKTIHHEGGVLS